MVSGISVGIVTAGFNLSMIKSVAVYKGEPEKAWYVAGTVLKFEIIYGLLLSLGLFLCADVLAHSFFLRVLRSKI